MTEEIERARTALSALALLAPAAQASSPTLTRADNRDGQDLSGTWHYSVDPYRDGLAGCADPDCWARCTLTVLSSRLRPRIASACSAVAPEI